MRIAFTYLHAYTVIELYSFYFKFFVTMRILTYGKTRTYVTDASHP